MQLDEVFDHVEASNDLEEEAEEHRERAAECLCNLVLDSVEFDAEVYVEQGRGDSFTVTVTPKSLTRLADSINEEEDTAASMSAVEIQVSQNESDIYLSQRSRIKNIKELIDRVAENNPDDPGAPVEKILEASESVGMDPGKAEQEIESLRRKGEVYEPQNGYICAT